MIDLKDYGFFGDVLEGEGIPARVTAVHKERYELICEYGEVCGKLKTGVYYSLDGSKEEFPTTGDFVRILYNPQGDSLIIKTLERKTFFSRRDPTPGRGEQAVAANFDFVFIVQSLNQNLNMKRLERYLTLAWQSGALPVVVLTKADLVPDASEQIRLAEQTAMGQPVYAVSAYTGFGIEALSAYLRPGKTIVFLGSSGVGKSSLINRLAREEIMAVNAVRESDSRGRHTTTHRQLLRLKSGAMVIDTPGMRELGMWDVSKGLGEAFEEVEQYMGLCKYSDCRHESEPGCAIRAAIERGELSRERWESYRALKREAKYSDDRASYKRKKQERNKSLAKNSRQKRKLREKTGG